MYNHVKRWKKKTVLITLFLSENVSTKGRRLVRMLVDLANPTMNYPVYPLLTLQQTVSTLFMFSPLICCGNKSVVGLYLMQLTWYLLSSHPWMYAVMFLQQLHVSQVTITCGTVITCKNQFRYHTILGNMKLPFK